MGNPRNHSEQVLHNTTVCSKEWNILNHLSTWLRVLKESTMLQSYTASLEPSPWSPAIPAGPGFPVDLISWVPATPAGLSPWLALAAAAGPNPWAPATLDPKGLGPATQWYWFGIGPAELIPPLLGSMDPEAGIHGSGGWDPWIRRLGPMDPEAGIHGSEPPKPASAGLGRPAGGRGPEVQKERKRVKSSRKCCHLHTRVQLRQNLSAATLTPTAPSYGWGNSIQSGIDMSRCPNAQVPKCLSAKGNPWARLLRNTVRRTSILKWSMF